MSPYRTSFLHNHLSTHHFCTITFVLWLRHQFRGILYLILDRIQQKLASLQNFYNAPIKQKTWPKIHNPLNYDWSATQFSHSSISTFQDAHHSQSWQQDHNITLPTVTFKHEIDSKNSLQIINTVPHNFSNWNYLQLRKSFEWMAWFITKKDIKPLYGSFTSVSPPNF